jgi:proteasome lid subunit RPN8/RPN11
LHLGVPQRLDLGAGQDDAALERLQDVEIVAGLAVLGHRPGPHDLRRLLRRSHRPLRYRSVLRLSANAYAKMIAHCYDGVPLEACGLLAGPPGSSEAEVCYPTRNAASSSRVYTVDPTDHLRADRDAEANGNEIIGVFHSHTHTDPYPSPTDVANAPDSEWHYVIVSLRDEAPMTRSYRIGPDGKITEEAVVLLAR